MTFSVSIFLQHGSLTIQPLQLYHWECLSLLPAMNISTLFLYPWPEMRKPVTVSDLVPSWEITVPIIVLSNLVRHFQSLIKAVPGRNTGKEVLKHHMGFISVWGLHRPGRTRIVLLTQEFCLQAKCHLILPELLMECLNEKVVVTRLAWSSLQGEFSTQWPAFEEAILMHLCQETPL